MSADRGAVEGVLRCEDPPRVQTDTPRRPPAGTTFTVYARYVGDQQ